MIWLFGHKAYGILVPQPGMEPALPDGKAKSQQWKAREVPGKCDHPNFFFFPHHMACGVLVPQPETEPTLPAVEEWHPNHWTTREPPIPTLEKRLLMS